MISSKVIVRNKTGFHVRPASMISKIAESCNSKIEFIHGYRIINGKSLLNILSAAIKNGDEIEVRCTGKEHEEQADLERMVLAIQNLED